MWLPLGVGTCTAGEALWPSWNSRPSKNCSYFGKNFIEKKVSCLNPCSAFIYPRPGPNACGFWWSLWVFIDSYESTIEEAVAVKLCLYQILLLNPEYWTTGDCLCITVSYTQTFIQTIDHIWRCPAEHLPHALVADILCFIWNKRAKLKSGKLLL